MMQTHVCACARVSACALACACAYVPLCECVCTYRACICMCVRASVRDYARVCACVRECVVMCVRALASGRGYVGCSSAARVGDLSTFACCRRRANSAENDPTAAGASATARRDTCLQQAFRPCLCVCVLLWTHMQDGGLTAQGDEHRRGRRWRGRR
jgi:hypothetical protein